MHEICFSALVSLSHKTGVLDTFLPQFYTSFATLNDPIFVNYDIFGLQTDNALTFVIVCKSIFFDANQHVEKLTETCELEGSVSDCVVSHFLLPNNNIKHHQASMKPTLLLVTISYLHHPWATMRPD